MKKLLAASIASLMLFSAAFCCFGASATNEDPYYPATDTIIIEKPSSGHFYTNNLNNFSKSIDGIRSTSIRIPVGLGTTPINLNGTAEGSDAIYCAILPYKLDSTAIGFSFTVCVPPQTHEYGPNVMNDIYIFGAPAYWNEAESNKTPAVIPTETEFVPLAKVENLSEKWKVSADGEYRYYEANFADPVTTEYVLIAFTQDSKDHLASGNTMYFNEFSIFTGSIPLADTAEKPTWTKPVIPETTPKPETTKGPETTQKPVLTKKPLVTTAPAETTGAPETKAPEKESGCGSVASFGLAAVIGVIGTAVIRKKED